MELNKEYKQIFLRNDSDYNLLKDKAVDKVAFTNTGNYDTHMCIITFTDKTFIALGTRYDEEDDPKLNNECIIPPQNWNNGNFNLYMYVNSDNKIIYNQYIRILRDFDITKLTKVGDLVAAFIMELRESSARYNGENFYILKGDLEVYLKDSDDWLPTMLNEMFGLTKLDLSGFEFNKGDYSTKFFDNFNENRSVKDEYAHVGKLRKFLNKKYKEYDK